jgi:putative SOS response-associated peptidase YedK
MCGRFAQAQSREEYLAHLVEAAERDIAWDPAPIGRYNVAPGTKVLLLNERDVQLSRCRLLGLCARMVG